MQIKIPFGGRAHFYTEDEISLISRVCLEASTLTQGPYLKAFEREFENFSGASGNAFAVNNATSALEMVAQMCLLRPGDEVIVPAHTYTSSAYPFAKKGGKIVWADIDPETRVVTPESIYRCITKNTKVIVVVHLYGYGADVKQICEIADERNIIVVEDAAQALGVYIDGKMAGTFGKFGVFSFHSHKNVSTLGEGGMLLVNDPSYSEVVPMLRHNGHRPYCSSRKDYWKPAMSDVAMPVLNGHHLMPNNYCLGEVECALGAALLDRVAEINQTKRKRAEKFISVLSDFELLSFHKEFSTRHNYHLLAARVDGGLRDDLMRCLFADFGVQTVVQYNPLYRYPLYQSLGFDSADCPHTDHFYDNMISFPFGLNISESDLEYVMESCYKAAELCGLK